MPVYDDGVGNYFIGTIDAGVTRTELWTGTNNAGLLNDIRTASGIRAGSRAFSPNLCYTWTAPLGVGGEVNTTATSTDGVTATSCDGAISDNARISVMLWSSSVSGRPATINSGSTNSQEVTVPIVSATDISSTWAIASNANARFWMTVSQQRYITFFCFVDQNNYYSIEMGYTNEVSGVSFPLNCIVKYNIMYQGSESWYAGVPTSIGLTSVTAIPQTGSRANYTHLTSAYASKDATNLYAVTSAGGIGRCGTNLKITRVPNLYSSLVIRSKFQTDSDVLGSSKRNYIVMGKSGVNDSSLIYLNHCNGAIGAISSASQIVNEVTQETPILIDPLAFTTTSKFGTSAVTSSGAGAFRGASTNLSRFNFGSSNFTVEFWLYWNGSPASGAICSVFPETSGGWTIGLSGDQLYYSTQNNSPTYFDSISWSATTWYHIAISRSTTNLRLFRNGTQVGATKTAIDCGAGTPTFLTPFIGGNNLIMDEIAIWTSAKYTANFTAPTSPYAVLPELIAMQTY